MHFARDYTRYSKTKSKGTAAAFIKGLNYKKSIIFNQSLVPSHSEDLDISCIARMGWLNRMTQFKEKVGKDKEKYVGLYILTFKRYCE